MRKQINGTYNLKRLNEVNQMAKRFEDMIDVLDYNELMRLKGDLDSGAIALKRLMEEKIRKKLKKSRKMRKNF